MKTQNSPSDQSTKNKKELFRLLLEVQHELTKHSKAKVYQEEIRLEIESMNTLIDILSERIMHETWGAK